MIDPDEPQVLKCEGKETFTLSGTMSAGDNSITLSGRFVVPFDKLQDYREMMAEVERKLASARW